MYINKFVLYEKLSNHVLLNSAQSSKMKYLADPEVACYTKVLNLLILQTFFITNSKFVNTAYVIPQVIKYGVEC